MVSVLSGPTPQLSETISAFQGQSSWTKAERRRRFQRRFRRRAECGEELAKNKGLV